jgi:hypothetical protein
VEAASVSTTPSGRVTRTSTSQPAAKPDPLMTTVLPGA